MKITYYLLVLTSVLIFLFPVLSIAQQNKTTTTSNPVYVVSEDGTSRVMIDGLTDKRDAEKIGVALSKKEIKENINSNYTSGSTGGLKTTFKSKPAGVDRIIKYGPWRMQNKLRLMTDSLAGILRFEGNRKIYISTETPVKRKLKIVRNDMETILKLSPRTQITVLEGHLYSVQIGQYAFNKSAYNVMDKVSALTTLPVLVVIKNGYYHLLVEGFQNLKEANLLIGQLAKIGYRGTLVRVREIGKASDVKV